MDPVSLGAMAAVSMGASAIGAGVNAYGSIQAGNAQKSMYDYKSAVAKINAQISEQNAQYETAAGEVESLRSGLKSRHVAGATRAIQGASNLDVNAGSAKNVQDSERDIAGWDQGLIRANAARRAYGYRVKGMQETAEGNIATAAGRNAQTAGYIGAASSILGGASSVSDKWLKASDMNLFG